MFQVLKQGRFGNNLFQFAFGYATSQRLGTSFFMQEPLIPEYFTLSNYQPPSPEDIEAFIQSSPPLYQTSTDNFDTPELLNNLKDHCIYQGFYQSEQFFMPFKEEILTLLTPRPHWVEQMQQACAEWFQRPTIAVHVRRGDYLETHPYCWALPLSFFHDCLARIPYLESYNVLFLSDSIDEVQAEFAHIPNAFFSRQSEFIDFLVMMHADILIGSNSSFSWWGGYLNRKPNKLVLAPKHHIGFLWDSDWPPGITVPEWTYIPVTRAN